MIAPAKTLRSNRLGEIMVWCQELKFEAIIVKDKISG